MLAGFTWLKDYIDITESPGEIAERLTMAGLEVDSVTESGPGFSGVVVGKITALSRHPNADKLSLCDVSTGDRIHKVVCGAANIHVGDVVPLATVGATIPGGYTIKHSKIRGEASEGMLCSEEELGIGDDATGIMILDGALPLGEDLAKALQLNDRVFDVAITPNRPDCLSMLGVAREIAALTHTKVRYPDSRCDEAGEDVHDITSVEILSPHLCPRYTARMIRNVEIKPSPSWLRMRLEAVGLRAINNVVDVTNFVMMEYGQPLHAFDFRFLEGGKIIVRGAAEGEEFISLDEKTRTLKKDTLMICDGVKPVAIAGIMGGLNSEVRDDTDTVLLESAYFNPSSIRKTSRLLGMSTDAAFRFERGVDPEGVTRALDRAASLIAQLSGGTVCRGCIDQYPQKVPSARDIPLRPDRVNEILGTDIAPSRMVEILENLEMECRAGEGGAYAVTPPTFRRDIYREIDLIEEIARLNGYEDIPITIPALSPREKADNQKEHFEDRVKSALNGQGYSEVINYSFTTPQSASMLGFGEDHECRRFVRIANPLTEDTSVMRTTIVYGLLDTMRRNIHVGTTDLKLFEIGKIFIETTEGALPLEKERIGGLLTGARYGETWHFKETPADVYDLKGCVDTLFQILGVEGVRFTADAGISFLHPGKAAVIHIGEDFAGVMGEVHPDVCEKMDISQRAFLFELDLSVLRAASSRKKSFKELPRYPAVTRDVAFLVSGDITGERMIALASGQEEELLESVRIFDVYTGKGIPEGMKSLALRFTYRAWSRTLADSEVTEVHRTIVEQVLKHSGAKIRGVE